MRNHGTQDYHRIVTENQALRKQHFNVRTNREFWPKFSSWFDFHSDERFRCSGDGCGLWWNVGNNPNPMVMRREDQSHL